MSLLRKAGATVGNNVVIAQGVRILGATKLTLEDDVSIARGTVLDARGQLTLRRGALIGFESIILTSTHNSGHADLPVHEQGMFFGPVTIGACSWLGARCIVQPGTSIADNSIIGSGAVVTKNLDKSAIYAGVPARFIRAR
ncbi:acyltransferase [Paenarthrobacter sp. AB444]|uniref:acyltransferase n=1 Tax=Paenarthrobacter sp. AB444 TaxID=3025681 RepID=UPI002366A52C|nr:acyltransferase [Paenarthrobacter sp. AB444]MDD7835648.1 acyltransferase [Paenarthrobacter sp. AB444]